MTREHHYTGISGGNLTVGRPPQPCSAKARSGSAQARSPSRPRSA